MTTLFQVLGGLGVFLGERCGAKFINEELYRNGQGLFPLPLAGPAQLLVDRLEPAPDLEVTDHPVFRVLAGQRNSFVATVMIERYFAAAKNWTPPADSTVRIIARLRNGAPLAVEQRFGQGRVVALLTTAAPVWNNWARGNPSYGIAMQELQAHLTARPAVVRLVGAPLGVELDPAQYQLKVHFFAPQATGPVSIEGAPTSSGLASAVLEQTPTSGIYEAHLAKIGAIPEVRRYAYNVDAAEGDLRRLAGPELAARLEGVRYSYEQAATLQYEGRELAGVDLSETLLYALVVLLILEQVLAWSAGYHPPARRSTAGRGGVR